MEGRNEHLEQNQATIQKILPLIDVSSVILCVRAENKVFFKQLIGQLFPQSRLLVLERPANTDFSTFLFDANNTHTDVLYCVEVPRKRELMNRPIEIMQHFTNRYSKFTISTFCLITDVSYTLEKKNPIDDAQAKKWQNHPKLQEYDVVEGGAEQYRQKVADAGLDYLRIKDPEECAALFLSMREQFPLPQRPK